MYRPSHKDINSPRVDTSDTQPLRSIKNSARFGRSYDLPMAPQSQLLRGCPLLGDCACPIIPFRSGSQRPPTSFQNCTNWRALRFTAWYFRRGSKYVRVAEPVRPKKAQSLSMRCRLCIFSPGDPIAEGLFRCRLIIFPLHWPERRWCW